MGSSRTALLPAATRHAMSLPDPATPLRPWLEQVWLNRYLDRELEGDEQAAFEAYLLTRPDLVAALEADNALCALVVSAAQGGLAIAQSQPEPLDAAGVEAPVRRMYDLALGATVEPRESPGDPGARSMVVDFALPPGWRIGAMWAIDGAHRLALPRPPRSESGIATCILPSHWRGRARLQLDLLHESRDAGRTVERVL